MNLHRSPLAGRNFECYSEDPLLSGKLAAGYVRGVQSVGVFATIKHFAANDAEFERGTINSVVDERSLRELYLMPFEIAVREGRALGLMTSYNRLNGRWLTEQPEFLIDILREEWGFEGLVMTDWFAVANTTESLAAGLDLEMPGPGRSLGSVVAEAVDNGVVKESDLDAAVERLLGAFDRIGILNAPTPPVEPRPPGPDTIDLLRQAAAEATVLLSNDGTLPLDPQSLRRIAVIGPNAGRPCLMGGGSAQVIPHRIVSPLEALTEALGGHVEVAHARGCEADLSPTLVGRHVLVAHDGFEVEVFEGTEWSGGPVLRQHEDQLRLCVFQSASQGYPENDWSMRMRGRVVPRESGLFELALAQAGRARVLVDGAVILDGFATPPGPGGKDFFGQASRDLTAEVRVDAGVALDLVVEFARLETAIAGVRVGFRTVGQDALLTDAVDAASSADVAVVVVGTTAEWETEGYDRTSLSLPGRQGELIRRVTEVAPKTVVVVNAGAPVDLWWADEASAVLQCWFGGQEMAGGVADVLTGRAEPGGRLATTMPYELRHNPSYDNFPGENGELRYGEGLFMGYRGYEHRGIAPRFAFGHGLSYTTFALGEPQPSKETFAAGETLTISVPVTNTGTRSGSEVVQCYVEPVSPRLVRPTKELKAFAKVRLEAGAAGVAELVLDDRSFSYWDPGQPDWDEIRQRGFDMFGGSTSPERRPAGWQLDDGEYLVHIGRASNSIAFTVKIRVAKN
jgi:beta-glucosidase